MRYREDKKSVTEGCRTARNRRNKTQKLMAAWIGKGRTSMDRCAEVTYLRVTIDQS